MFLIFTMLAKITWKREEVWNIFNDILCFVALPRCLPFCDIYNYIYVLLKTLFYLKAIITFKLFIKNEIEIEKLFNILKYSKKDEILPYVRFLAKFLLTALSYIMI